MRHKNVLLILGIVIIFLLTLVGYFIFTNFQSQKNIASKTIQSFEDCVKAGYPVMESYPRQCKTPAGQNFVEQIQNQPPEIITGVKSQLYDNKEFGFQFWSPENSKVEEQSLAGYLSLTETSIVTIFLDQNLFAGTNLGEAVIVIGIDSNQEALDNCNQAKTDNDEQDLGESIINGVPFHKFFTTGVGAGNLYESTIYRAVQAGRCYEIVEVLHSGNIGNYTPGAVTEFDKPKFSEILEKIVQTFEFIGQ